MTERSGDMAVALEPVVGLHTLANGRTYRISDTGRQYEPGEYPTGGFHIAVQLPSGQWSYIDNSPDAECVRNFLRAAARLAPNAELSRVAAGEPKHDD